MPEAPAHKPMPELRRAAGWSWSRGRGLPVLLTAAVLLLILAVLLPTLAGRVWSGAGASLALAAAGLSFLLFLLLRRDRTGSAAGHGVEIQALHPSLLDPLTGLPNRYLLDERLQRQIAESEREGRRFALMLIDLNRFREVNEAFGREVGDRVLQRVAERIRSPLRDVDTVARVDGDEFALLVRVNTREQAQLVATKVLDRLDRPCEIVGSRLPVQASIGVAFFPEHGRDATALLQHAEAARLAANRAADRCAVYEPGEDPGQPDRLALLAGLRDGLREGQLYLVLQPKRDLGSPGPAKYEALVRWRHPAQGDLAPGDFLPFLEQTGAITDLTQWVVTEALRLLADARAAAIAEVAVNLSVRVLEDAGFPVWVERQLKDSAVAPRRLRFEVTETAIMEDSRSALEVLQMLAALGVGLSLDDFGVGHSSLAYLARLPVDEIKIDRGFVAGLTDGGGNRAIVRATIDLGHDLGLRVVAEGVESEAQARLLAEMGCDVLQGHLLGPTLPLAQLLTGLDY
ncbi:MAG: hypothetical protein RLZ44_1714 [Pseudomonadota bacterium]